jgi:hypothetical protein
VANLKTTNIQGTLSNTMGQVSFETMPISEQRPIIERSNVSNFFAWGTYYRVEQTNPIITNNRFAQNPLSTTPQVVNMAAVIPETMRGNVAGVEVWIDSRRLDPSGMIFMIKPRGAPGSGNDWTNYGYLYSNQTSRIAKNYTVSTDLNGDFEIWAYTSGWTPQIAFVYLRGVYLRA